MLSIDEINNTITELENGKTTFDTCSKLASLYIVRDNMGKNETDTVIEEYHDILPQYSKYCEIKKKYQMHELSETQVLQSMSIVCTEIQEFIETLYTNSDMIGERNLINSTLVELVSKINI